MDGGKGVGVFIREGQRPCREWRGISGKERKDRISVAVKHGPEGIVPGHERVGDAAIDASVVDGSYQRQDERLSGRTPATSRRIGPKLQEVALTVGTAQ